MKIIPSSMVRSHLSRLARDVSENNETIGIQQSSNVVVLMTKDAPQSGPPAMRIRLEVARKGWSDLTEIISILRVSYYLKIRLGEDEALKNIYLVPAPDHSNQFYAEAKANKLAYDLKINQSKSRPDILINLNEYINDQIKEKEKKLIEQMKANFDELSHNIVIALERISGV